MRAFAFTLVALFATPVLVQPAEAAVDLLYVFQGQVDYRRVQHLSTTCLNKAILRLDVNVNIVGTGPSLLRVTDVCNDVEEAFVASRIYDGSFTLSDPALKGGGVVRPTGGSNYSVAIVVRYPTTDPYEFVQLTGPVVLSITSVG